MRKYLLKGLTALAMCSAMTACTQDFNYDEQEQQASLNNAQQTLGFYIPENQDWVMSGMVTANVPVNVKDGEVYTVKVYSNDPLMDGVGYVLATGTVNNGQNLSISADSLLDKVFTGGAKDLYQGSFRYHYTYMDKQTAQMTELSLDGLAIEDRVGAILVDKPIVKPVADNINKLTVYISEATRMNEINGIQFLEFKDRTEQAVHVLPEKSTYRRGAGRSLA